MTNAPVENRENLHESFKQYLDDFIKSKINGDEEKHSKISEFCQEIFNESWDAHIQPTIQLLENHNAGESFLLKLKTDIEKALILIISGIDGRWNNFEMMKETRPNPDELWPIIRGRKSNYAVHIELACTTIKQNIEGQLEIARNQAELGQTIRKYDKLLRELGIRY